MSEQAAVPGVATALVERLLPATPDVVYDEWLDPASLLEWMCPRPARCLRVDVEPWLGGRLHLEIEDSGQRFSVSGIFTDLDRPSRLGFTWTCTTWPDPTLVSQVIVTLEPSGPDRTRMTIAHSALAAELRDQHRAGWQLIADQLAAALA